MPCSLDVTHAMVSDLEDAFTTSPLTVAPVLTSAHLDAVVLPVDLITGSIPSTFRLTDNDLLSISLVLETGKEIDYRRYSSSHLFLEAFGENEYRDGISEGI